MKEKLAHPHVGRDWHRNAAGLVVPREYGLVGRRRSGLATSSPSIDSYSFITSAYDNADTTSPVNFNSLGIGTADASRIVLVGICAFAYTASDPAITGVTINGSSMTERVNYNGTNYSGYKHCCGWFTYPLATGTTANFAVSFAGYDNNSKTAIAVYRLLVTGTLSVYDTMTVAGNDPSGTIDYADGGFVAAGVFFLNSSGNTWTWTGHTEDFDVDTDTSDRAGSAHVGGTSQSTGNSISVAESGTNGGVLVGVSLYAT